MRIVEVDCTFAADGKVRVRRIAVQGRWQAVEQGRQWVDEDGRHVLVMPAGERAQELILRRESLDWVMVPAGAAGAYAV